MVVPRLDVLDGRLGARAEGNRPKQLVGPDRNSTLLRKRLRLRLAEADGLDIRRASPERVLADVRDVALTGPEAETASGMKAEVSSPRTHVKNI